MHDVVPLHSIELNADEVFWLLAGICAAHALPFHAPSLQAAFPPPYTLATLRQMADALELDSHLGTWDAGRWQNGSLPAICLLLPSGEQDRHQPALLLGCDGANIRLRHYPQQDAALMTLTACPALQGAPLLRTARKRKRATDPREDGDQPEPFGFAWFFPALLKHRDIWRDVLLASLAIQLLALAVPLVTQVIIDKVVAHNTRNTLLVLGLALLLATAFSAVLGWLRQTLLLHTGNRIDAVLGSEVFRHLLRLPLRWHEKHPTGSTVTRLQGVETIRSFITGAAVTLLLDLPFMLVFLALMLAWSWKLSLIALTLLALVALLSVAVTPVLRARMHAQFHLGARGHAFLSEYVAGMGTVKSLQMEPEVARRHGELLADYLAAGYASGRLANGYQVLASFLEQLMTIAILTLGALMVMEGKGFTIGMLVAFQMFAGRMSQPLMRLVGLWQEFQQADIAVRRLGDVLNVPAEPQVLQPRRRMGGDGAVTFVEVAFRYGDNLPWLYRRLSFHLKPGSLTVLSGPSGCGKSTVARLLLGFHRPDDGRILIDGQDIRSMAANELRMLFGVVPQETVLFAGTVLDNLLLAAPHASFDEVIQACRDAGIHDVIEQLPEGYQAVIGERGTGLSGGQRQRLSIARALLRQPRILIFDEAVSSLDQHTAEQFARTVNGLKGRATILFITHHIPRGLQVDEVFAFGGQGEASRLDQIRPQ